MKTNPTTRAYAMASTYHPVHLALDLALRRATGKDRLYRGQETYWTAVHAKLVEIANELTPEG